MDEESMSIATHQFPGLPPELVLIIFQLLSHEDQKTFSLLSQSCRQLALPTLFRKIVYSDRQGAAVYRIKKLKTAKGDIKAAIKELVLNDFGYRSWDYKTTLFPFLRTLPNLQCFRWNHSIAVRNRPFLNLVASLRHCPLEHLTYWGPHGVPEGPVTGPPRLKTLSVKLHHAHIYDLIRPSLSTLVELEMYPGSVRFDLLPLRPLGRTLRKFAYKMNGFDQNLLDTIPDVFPHLTTLELVVWDSTRFQWMDSYDHSLAKNTKLQYLAVFAHGFLFCGGPRAAWSHSGCLECQDQRIKAMRVLAMVCIGLKRCRWNHCRNQYFLNVTLSPEGNLTAEVEIVVGIEVYSPEPFIDCRWMGDQRRYCDGEGRDGGIGH